MEHQIERMFNEYEKGTLTRRQVITRMMVLAATAGAAGTARTQGDDSTFTAVGLNHIALRVPDVAKSRDFYVKHLGMRVTRESLPGNVFLGFDNGFLALFRGEPAGLDHYCYSVEGYSADAAVETLREAGLEPRRPSGSNRVYFPDADGLTVQLAAPDHRA